MKKLMVFAFVTAVVLAALPFITGNLETEELNDEARKDPGLKFVQLTDGTVHYDVSGPENGEVVVLVHGNAAPYFSWDKNMTALAGAGFRVIRYDLYGFGYSDRPDVDYSRALYDRQLVELLEKLEIRDPVNLVGTSQGGSIAVYFTAAHPEKVKKLALLSPFINILPMKAVISLIKIPGMGEYLGSVLLDRVNINYPKKVFANPDAIPPEYTQNYRKQLAYKGFKRARISNLRGDALADFTAQYEAVDKTRIPVLFTWGSADKVIMSDSVANIRKAMPSVEYHEIEGGGHLVHYENAEPVNKILVNFLKK
jgi:pimeloyl-ACP methyl ester carboxylesterase